MTEKQPHVVQMEQERNDLNSKITSLIVLITDTEFRKIPAEDQALLATQLNAMQAYSNILDLRINRAL